MSLLCYSKSAIMAYSGQMWLFLATRLGEGGPEVSYELPLTSWEGWMSVGGAPVVVLGGWWCLMVVRERKLRERERAVLE